ncbi:hypothetical protein [Actinokineospora pegani]|uniref:hypothetical protein n=1 Tax=Actinokineospora pegani TaxID=2654637 RepID=UPI0038B3D827
MEKDIAMRSTTQTEPPSTQTELPTDPCSVVWSRGRAYVLEPPVWVGLDSFGRACRLAPADLQRQGWSRHR